MDAHIKSLDSLSLLYNILTESLGVVSSDCKAVAEFMDQKLSELIKVRSDAESMVSDIRQKYNQAMRFYAQNVSNMTDVSSIQRDLTELERALRDSEYSLDVLTNAVNVCRNQVAAIIEETHSFNCDSSIILDSGRTFVQNSSQELLSYITMKNKA